MTHKGETVSVKEVNGQQALVLRMSDMKAYWTDAANLEGNRLTYACGCIYPTTEPSHYYDHNCASCYTAMWKRR